MVVLEAAIDDETLHVTIRDHGTWREPVPDPTRGRGRLLMQELADDFDLRSEPVGTVVSLGFKLNGRVAP